MHRNSQASEHRDGRADADDRVGSSHNGLRSAGRLGSRYHSEHDDRDPCLMRRKTWRARALCGPSALRWRYGCDSWPSRLVSSAQRFRSSFFECNGRMAGRGCSRLRTRGGCHSCVVLLQMVCSGCACAWCCVMLRCRALAQLGRSQAASPRLSVLQLNSCFVRGRSSSLNLKGKCQCAVVSHRAVRLTALISS